MKTDANKTMLEKLDAFGRRPKILLHACCAPCASACLLRLTDRADVTVYFYNPNIMPREEYDKRAEEMRRFLSEAPFCKNVGLVVGPYESELYLDAVKGLEQEPERGARCTLCYEMRLRKTFEQAGEYDFFATTLTLSPLKDAERLNAIGTRIGDEKYLCSDYKKQNGYLDSLRLSQEYGLYRQNFCGCPFSRIKNEYSGQ